MRRSWCRGVLAVAALLVAAAPAAAAFPRPVRDADYVGRFGSKGGNIWFSVSRDGRRVYSWHATGVPVFCEGSTAAGRWDRGGGAVSISRGEFAKRFGEAGDSATLEGDFVSGGRAVGVVTIEDGRASCEGDVEFRATARKHRRGLTRPVYDFLFDKYGKLQVSGIDELPDGSLIVAAVDDGNAGSIRRIDPNGPAVTLLGPGDGAYLPGDVAALPGGGYVFSEPELDCVKRVSADGDVSTAAGQCGNAAVREVSGDGGPAAEAHMFQPGAIEGMPDGGFLVVDGGRGGDGLFTSLRKVRRVWPDGTITTLAGNGMEGSSGDLGPATAATFTRIRDVALEPAGSVLIADEGGGRVRRVGTDGVILTVAGSGFRGFSGDGRAATGARITPTAVEPVPAGDFLISDGHRLRRVFASGRIGTIAGGGEVGSGIPAGRAGDVSVLKVLQNGSMIGPDKLIAAKSDDRLLAGLPARAITYRRAVLRRRAFPIAVTRRTGAIVQLRSAGRAVMTIAKTLPAGRSTLRFPRRARLRRFASNYIVVTLTSSGRTAGARIDLLR